jgi:hypothetical protein
MRHAKLAVLFFGLAATMLAADPAAGTWKLNLAKSKFSPGPAPKSATVTYKETAGGIHRTGETINADGTKTSFEYTAKFDSADYPIKGSDAYDAIAIKRIDDLTAEATLKKAGKVVATAKRVVSKDGKTMTLTISSTNAKGEKSVNTSVYEKQ